jgi:hypothetical protein
MAETNAAERPRREFDVGQDRWLAIDAWRDSGDLGLCYLLPLEGGTPARNDRNDRRATLAPGQALSDLDLRDLATLWSGGVGLTDTERRFTDPDDALWLARNTGPVWADSTASDSTGVLFRCLSAARADVEVIPVGSIRGEPTDRLRKLLARATASP